MHSTKFPAIAITLFGFISAKDPGKNNLGVKWFAQVTIHPCKDAKAGTWSKESHPWSRAERDYTHTCLVLGCLLYHCAVQGLDWCSLLSGCLPMAAKAIKAIPQRHVQDQFELDNPIFRLLDQLTLIWVKTMIKAYHHTVILFQILNEMM